MAAWQFWLVAALVLNLLTYAVYAVDKAAAQRSGARRVPERHLHLLALAGGWPAAWLAQQRLRHKTLKPRFRAVFWATVVTNLGLLALAGAMQHG